MKSIRHGVFETNSSSTHSLTICSGEEWDRFMKGDVYLNEDAWSSFSSNKDKRLVTKEEAIEILTNNKYPPEINLSEISDDELNIFFRDNGVYNNENYWDEYLESFSEKYTTKNGETVVAFGQYGHD